MTSREARIKKLFDHFDANKNGVLEKCEFVQGFNELVSSLGDGLNSEEVETIATEAISNFDLNGNGVIEVDEFNNLIDFLINEKGLKFD